MAAPETQFLKDIRSGIPLDPPSPERLWAFQTRQLRNLIDYAYHHVPFYQRIWDEAGFDPRDFHTLRDLERIPITTRAQRQSTSEEDLLSRDANPSRMLRDRTSGSSGQPLMILKTKPESWLHSWLHWKMYYEAGVRPWHRRASIGIKWGPRRVKDWRLQNRLHFYPMEKIDILVPTDEILAGLRDARPEILICPTSMAGWLGGKMRPADRERIHPRLLVTWGETATAELRQQAREGFRCRIVDFYGSHETRMIAAECSRTGLYHTFDNTTLVEVLRDGRPVAEGEDGEVVVTALWSYGMPFIRYRQGDVARCGPARCPCGAAWGTLSAIEGRVLDRIPLPGGDSIHPYHVIGVIVCDEPWIKHFQFMQEAPGSLRVLVVAHERPGADRLGAVEQSVRHKLGDAMDVQVELVDEIPLPPTGKYYPYVSLERRRSWAVQ